MLDTNNKHQIPIFLFPDDSTWYPLGLGMLQAYIEASPLAPFFKFYHPAPNMLHFLDKIIKTHPTGIWLFSNYLWTVEKNLRYSKTIKELSPESVMIHGGPSTPKYEQDLKNFLTANPHVDIAVHAEGEYTFQAILERLLAIIGQQPFEKHLMEGVESVSYLDKDNVLQKQPDRARIVEVENLPSPYLTGVFDNKTNIWENRYIKASHAVFETNRGCPYKCTFCDWGALTQQKIKLFPMDRVKKEIEWLGKHKIISAFIADANFGIFDRDVEIAQYYADVKRKTGYPKEIIANYAKNATERIAEITKIWVEVGLATQGILSIQTRDEETLKIIKRSNIKTKKYDELAIKFEEMELPLSTDLMIGLPGATVSSFKNDLQRYFDKNIWVKAYNTTMLPNSPMAAPEYREKYKIKINEQARLISTYSYTEADLKHMKNIYSHFFIFENLAFLRYILRYLQWDWGIESVEFIELIVNEKLESAMSLARDKRKYAKLIDTSEQFKEQLYQDIRKILSKHYPEVLTPTYDMVEKVNKAVMPEKNQQNLPFELFLEHDITAYFRNRIKDINDAKLDTYPPATFLIEDFKRPDVDKKNKVQMNYHQSFWELKNPMRKHQSEPNFVSA